MPLKLPTVFDMRDNLPHPPMAQPEPLGAHAPLEEAVAKVENTLRASEAPHFGHLTSVLLSDILWRSSNFSPQLIHSYSYKGIQGHLPVPNLISFYTFKLALFKAG